MAFVLIDVPAPESGGVVDKLMGEGYESVKISAAVYGEADVIVKIDATSVEELHAVVMKEIQPLEHVRSTRTYVIIPSDYRARDSESGADDVVMAFVLIDVPPPQSGQVVEQLMGDGRESVKVAAAVYGQTDVIAKVGAASIDEITAVIMRDIQAIEHVRSTRTFIVIPGFYKTRR